MLDLLVPLFTAAGVFFLVTVVVVVLRRAYGEYEERYLAKRVTDLSEMFLFVGPRQLVLLTAAVTAALVLLGMLLQGPVAMAVLGVVGLATPSVLVRFYRSRRREMLERQLVEALLGMASAFRAGMSLNQVIQEVARVSEPPLSQELLLTARETRLGKSTEEALENLARRVESNDLALVVTAINTARATGGNTAELLDRLSATVRERFRVESRIRTLTAQGKLQGIVIGVMPLVVWLGFDAIRPDLTRPMLRHWFGWLVVGAVTAMELLGAFFIRRITAIVV